uniref:Uncharacterized protein n=1 Tax=Otolemur garnettii TaxID=30611 RepID=H0Y0T1_OTOGA
HQFHSRLPSIGGDQCYPSAICILGFLPRTHQIIPAGKIIHGASAFQEISAY